MQQYFLTAKKKKIQHGEMTCYELPLALMLALWSYGGNGVVEGYIALIRMHSSIILSLLLEATM